MDMGIGDDWKSFPRKVVQETRCVSVFRICSKKRHDDEPSVTHCTRNAMLHTVATVPSGFHLFECITNRPLPASIPFRALGGVRIQLHSSENHLFFHFYTARELRLHTFVEFRFLRSVISTAP